MRRAGKATSRLERGPYEGEGRPSRIACLFYENSALRSSCVIPLASIGGLVSVTRIDEGTVFFICNHLPRISEQVTK